MRFGRILIWVVVALLGAGALGKIELHGLDLQGMRYPDDVQQSNVPFATLDPANIIPVQTR